MKCRYCNAEVKPNVRYCATCGGDLSKFDKCANCGELIDKGISVCPYCGTKQLEKKHDRQNDSKLLKWIWGCVLLFVILCVRYFLFGVGDSTQAIRGTDDMEVKRHAYVLVRGVTVLSSVMDGLEAKSIYDKQLTEINRANMSGKEKAIANDKAEKKRNKIIGGSVGSIVVTAAGAALGSVLGPFGAVAGGWLGSMVGEWVGDGMGGLFGGNRSEKYEKIAHNAKCLIVTGNNLLTYEL